MHMIWAHDVHIAGAMKYSDMKKIICYGSIMSVNYNFILILPDLLWQIQSVLKAGLAENVI